MAIFEFLKALQDSPIAHVVSKSNHLVGAALQIIHVLGFVLLLAALVLLCLRMLGLAFGAYPLSLLGADALHLIGWGLAAAVFSGALMFIASPLLYAKKPVFLFKMVLLLVATASHLLLLRPSALRGTAGVGRLRLTAALSLVIWFGVAATGRMIGFV